MKIPKENDKREEFYWELIGKLKSHFTHFNWMLEEYWNPNREN